LDFFFDLLFAFFESFSFSDFLHFFFDFALFFFSDFASIDFFLGFGFVTVFFAFFLAVFADFMVSTVSFFAAAIVASARMGPNPTTSFREPDIARSDLLY
jgi:hypothetical protein